MPCNSEYLRETQFELECRRAAQLLSWVCQKLGREFPPWAQEIAKDIYGKNDDHAILELCSVLTELGDRGREALIYGDAHDPIARELASWWERHEQADIKRIKSRWVD